jgi:hypothetical protein
VDAAVAAKAVGTAVGAATITTVMITAATITTGAATVTGTGEITGTGESALPNAVTVADM